MKVAQVDAPLVSHCRTQDLCSKCFALTIGRPWVTEKSGLVAFYNSLILEVVGK
jgi:hypothetical protein